jgi:amino acid transporter
MSPSPEYGEHEHHTPQQERTKSKSFWLTPSGLVALIIILIIGYYLIAEDGAHIAGFFAAFPWLLLIKWPTILTLIMFPVLVYMCVSLLGKKSKILCTNLERNTNVIGSNACIYSTYF